MAKRLTPEERIEPTLPPDRAKELIKKQMDEIDKLLQLRHDDPEVRKWDNITEQVLIKSFGKPSENLSDFYSARDGGAILMAMDEYRWQEKYIKNLQKCKKLLEGFIEQLEMFTIPTPSLTEVEEKSRQPLSKKIFIVHGHDEQSKTELTLILTRLGLEPIVLHEKPSEGLTLIEKLEKHSDVGFAFILLTPDDLGECIENKENLKPRARQNVVFEFGLFVGKVGRNRTCCLYKGNTELPSDLHGLVYLPFEKSVNEIQLNIVKELRAAGYKVEI